MTVPKDLWNFVSHTASKKSDDSCNVYFLFIRLRFRLSLLVLFVPAAFATGGKVQWRTTVGINGVGRSGHSRRCCCRSWRRSIPAIVVRRQLRRGRRGARRRADNSKCIRRPRRFLFIRRCPHCILRPLKRGRAGWLVHTGGKTKPNRSSPTRVCGVVVGSQGRSFRFWRYQV